MLFVCVEHQLSQDGKLCIHEEQDLVFREAASQPSNKEQVIQATPAATEAEPSERQDFSHTVIPSTTLLFRYSALTFNTHRIHYDREYACNVEHYPGLVVHGPLLATLLLEELRKNLSSDARISYFEFRAKSPVFDLTPFTLCGATEVSSTEGSSKEGLRKESTLWIKDDSNNVCLTARAHLANHDDKT